jgi:hypothetical protein
MEQVVSVFIGCLRHLLKLCDRRDVIVYALGVGVTEPAFAFEDHEDFAPLPTYPLVLSFKGESQDVVPFGVGRQLTVMACRAVLWH